MHRKLIAAAAACTTAFIATTSAFAHVSLVEREAAPGSFKATLAIPHGCEGEATNSVEVRIPEGFVSVKPMPKAGWTISMQTGDYDQTYTVHGREVSSGVKVVKWEGGALENAHYDEFVLRGSVAGEPGTVLYFDTIQHCASGTEEWVEHPAEGQDPHELEGPAPSLTIVAGNDSHAHHGHGAPGAEAGLSAGSISIEEPWARAMLPGQPAGGAWINLTNIGEEDDRLISLSSPVAEKVEVHMMEVVEDVMTMRPLEEALVVPAGETITMHPGGLHLMFMQVTEPFKEGESVPLTLEFEKAGKVELELPVKPANHGRGSGGHDHKH